MDTKPGVSITVEVSINAPIEKVWLCWTDPKHIVNWCHASDDWHAPHAENDLRVGGRFSTTMAALDGSVSFDFGGIYTRIEEHKVIEYTLDDDRKVSIFFTTRDKVTTMTETFEAESENTPELQQSGWQAILNNFKEYAERN